MLKDFEDETWDKFNQCLIGKQLYLFGASTGGNKFLKEYSEKYTVSGIFDNDPKKWGKDFDHIAIRNPQEIDQLQTDQIVILITSIYIKEISQQLIDMKIENYFSFLFLRRQGINWDINETDLPQIELLRDLLSDEKSVYILDQIIDKRRNGFINYINIQEDNQYFVTDFMKPRDNEVFVDAGAYDGDTINKFIRWVGHDRYKIFALEPEIENFHKLHDMYSDSKILCINEGLWSSNKKIYFNSGHGTDSAVNEQGNLKIQVNTLDELVQECVSMIKMDIEGSEMQALLGAKDTIVSHHPRLAICVYHRRDDLWKLPILIHEMVPEYKLYLRHHNSDASETVIYAVI